MFISRKKYDQLLKRYQQREQEITELLFAVDMLRKGEISPDVFNNLAQGISAFDKLNLNQIRVAVLWDLKRGPVWVS